MPSDGPKNSTDTTDTQAASTTLRHDVQLEERGDGALLLRSALPLAPVAHRTTDWLEHWARIAPNRVFMAERSGAGWREMSFGEMREQARAIAAGLLARGLGPTSPPIALLSGASVNHAILTLAAQYIGAATVPLAEQYSLLPEARGRLEQILAKVRPALVYAEDAGKFSAALTQARQILPQAQIVTAADLDTLIEGASSSDLDAANALVGPETLAKILFTSGSTSEPKGVLTTQRMLCFNQAQIASVVPFLAAGPPKIIDWLPWNHTFGSSHNFNLMLANGGSFYIDAGRPLAGAFETTLANLQDQAGTISFNVPAGFTMLVASLAKDAALRRTYFRDLEMIFYSGATVPEATWCRLQEMAIEERGAVPLMVSAWGLTETSPAAVMVHEPVDRAGIVGVPLPGTELKLLPISENRYEIRLRGDNVMPGYFEDAARTTAAFDAEGYFISGDAVRFVDVNAATAGLSFDGRLGEDFKLTTGTWVKSSALRLEALAAFADIAQDVIITGSDRAEIGLLIFPNPAYIAGQTAHKGAFAGDQMRGLIEDRLRALAATASGSSTRITRALVLSEPPSVEDQEVAAKGNININRVLERRSGLVERLYDDGDGYSDDDADPAVMRLK